MEGDEIMRYYKNVNNETFVDPILANHNGLVEITESEFLAIANPPKTALQLQEEAIAHYKSLYMNLVSDKLKELDYDSLATVKLWEGDATFGAEATKILNWYKGIIQRNYELLNAGFPMTDEEYLVALSVVVF